MFGQTFDFLDLGTLGVLILLEAVLSIDNAIVLSLLARRVEARLRSRALGYGLVAAMAFRVVAVILAAYLLQWRIVQLLGGAYLVYVVIRHFLHKTRASRHPPGLAEAADAGPSGFWRTVAAIELTDAAFAVDSILAAIALVGPAPADAASSSPTSAPSGRIVFDAPPNPKLWLVMVGGGLGIVLMRFAAAGLLRLIDRFPRFELSGYLIVLLIGLKLIIAWWAGQFRAGAIDFENFRRPEFWVFWFLLMVCVAIGFIPADARRRAMAAVR
jgi:YkoY family integral membrane protein